MSKQPLRISFSPDAKRDLIERADLFAIEAGLHTSDRFVEALAHTVDLLTQMPAMGRVFRSANKKRREIRTFPVSSVFHRHIIFYSCTAVELRIERIVHSAQDLRLLFP